MMTLIAGTNELAVARATDTSQRLLYDRPAGRMPAARGRTIRRPRQARGQVMVITVLAILLLVGLIFYVMNVGDQVNRRVAAQDAADSAAISAGIQMARSMNTIAIDNINISRLLSLVPIMDALPLSVEMSYSEVLTWRNAIASLRAQMDQQFSVTDPLKASMLAGFDSLYQRLDRQREILEPLQRLLNEGGFDMSTKTAYRRVGTAGPPPHGSYWLAADHLHKFSQATVASAGVAAQINAGRYGQVSQADSAFAIPVVPNLPAVEGMWRDWYRNPGGRDTVLVHGHPPDYAPTHRLGGFDKLFRWRRDVHRPLPGQGVAQWVPGTGGLRRGVQGSPASGRSVGRGAVATDSPGHFVRPPGQSILVGYSTYGPFEWLRNRLHSFWARDLRDNSFNSYHGTLAQYKLEYMFSSSPVIRKVHFPQWLYDYPTVQQVVNGGGRVTTTVIYQISIRSRYAADHPRFLEAGSYVSNADNPVALYCPGWEDPANWNLPKIADHVWEDRWEYETTQDVSIGIYQPGGMPQAGPPTGADLEWFPVYVVDRYVFACGDVGGEWPVTNPANFDSTDGLPVPHLLDTSVGDYSETAAQPRHDQGVRRDYFTYLGVARRSAIPTAWPQRFGTANPSGSIAAVAQVEIYNPSSWDLWTQNWRAQLVPVSGLANWTDRLEAGMGDADRVNMAVPQRTLREVLEYLQRFDDELANQTIHH